MLSIQVITRMGLIKEKLHKKISEDLDKVLEKIIEIESSYDEFDRASFEAKKLKSYGIDAELWNLYELLWDKNFKELFYKCEILFTKFTDANAKAFIIQVAIAASELLFDLNLRKKWLRLWNHLNDYENSAYAQHLYLYHRGNSFYFEGNRVESIKQWSKALEICHSINYKRGIFRLQYFIGKAYSDLGFLGQSYIFYNNALTCAQSVNAIRFIERIQVQLNKGVGSKNYLFTKNQIEIFDLIKKNKIKNAKKLTLFYCRCRRDENRQWGSESEWILLAWHAFIENKLNRFFFILDFIDSDNAKWITLKTSEELNPAIISLDYRFKHNLNLLSSINSALTNKESPNQIIIAKPDQEVDQLIQLLKNQPNGVLKEDICYKLWNYEYDPILHDQRIYLLISKIRKFFGSKNSIINSYGGRYRLNKLLA